MSMRTRLLALAGAALAIVLLLGTATTAFAASEEPTMGLSALQATLTASGPISGYFKTVIQGQTIQSIECTISGITTGDRAGTKLILIQSADAQSKWGGIVAGMSGSPLYVNDGGVDKVVGAVSYGPYFGLNGVGGATPIEEMLDLKTLTEPPAVLSMRHPVLLAGKVIDRVIIAGDPQDFAGAAANGAFVAKPLAEWSIGGLDPSSTAYKVLAGGIAKHHIALANAGAASAGLEGDIDSELSTDLAPGASVAALAARGDLWVGGIGTVTSTDGNTVLAFGHPLYQDGNTSLYMANAWIDGIWPSSLESTKLGRPTATRGEITQDRFAGIKGTVDQFPAETTITAVATDLDASKTVTTHAYIPRKQLNTGLWDGEIVAAAESVAAEKLLDVASISGSAQTTTTIVVSDGTHEYTAMVPNMYDSTDLGWDVTEDTYSAIDELQSTLDSGVTNLNIESVKLEVSFQKAHRTAEIAEVKLVGALQTGENTATVKYVDYNGTHDFVSRDVTFTIPAGMPLSGVLNASSTDDYYFSDNEDYTDSSDDSDGGSSSMAATSGPITDWIETVADAVGYINSTQPYNVVDVTYTPYSGNSLLVAEATSTTGWYLTDSASVRSPIISTDFEESTVDYRGGTIVDGWVSGPTANSQIQIYGKVQGESTERHIKTVTAKYNSSTGAATFETHISGLPATTKLRFHVGPSDGWLSADVTHTLKVRGYTHLTASSTSFKAGKTITLKASVLSTASAGSKVTFQYWSPSYYEWRTLGSSKTLAVSGGAARASTTWKPGKGTRKVRVKFLGGAANAASTSNTVKLHVK